MAKIPNNPKGRNAEKAAIVKIVSETYGVSGRQVYRIINGERKNELLKITFEEIQNILQMAKKRSSQTASIVERISLIHKKSKRQVYRIISGEQTNDEVLSSFMFMQEGVDGLNNELLEAVKKLVPIN